MTPTKPADRARLLVSLVFVWPFAVCAAENAALSIHGEVSATAAYSDEYNLLGDTAGRANLTIAEVILNGAHRFESGGRIAAQLYAYRLGDYESLALDFATFDYAVNQSFGVRVGRVKNPVGLYGDTLDIDSLRPFAFLPLDFYPKNRRPLIASFDGASLYGNVPLGRAGSLDYQVFGGWFASPDPKAPFFEDFSSTIAFDVTHVPTPTVYGAWLAWNTPVDGLRLSASFNATPEARFEGSAHSLATLATVNSDARLLAFALPPGLWDMMVAGKPSFLKNDGVFSYFGAEYTRGNWQYAVEAGFTDYKVTLGLPVIGESTTNWTIASYYGSVTWQVAPKLQLGSYFGFGYHDDPRGKHVVSIPRHTAWLKDTAFAASYGVTRSWLVKAEVHFMNGTKGLSAGNGDAARWKPNWRYVVVKTTYTF